MGKFYRSLAASRSFLLASAARYFSRSISNRSSIGPAGSDRSEWTFARRAKKSMQVLAEGDSSQSARMSLLPDLSPACLVLLCSGVVFSAAFKGPRKYVGLVAVLLVTLLPGSDIESKLDSAQEQWARLGSALGQWLEGEGTTPLTLTTTGSTSQEALQGEWLAALGALLLLALSSKFPAKTASPHQQSLPLAGNTKDTRIGRRRQSLVGRRSFLCDTCKSNYREACQLDVRPNAIICADYNRLG